MPAQTRTTAEFDAQVDDGILRQKVNLLFVNGKSANATVLIAIPIVAWYLSSQARTEMVLGWFIGMTLISLTRLWLIARYQTRAPDDSVRMRRWAHLYSLITALLGCGWAAIVLFFLPHSPPETQLFVALLGVGVIAGSVTALHTYYLAYLAYTLPIMIALCIGYVLAGNAGLPGYIALTSLTVIFYLLLINTVRNNLGVLSQALRLGFENARLSRDAQAANQAKTDFLATISHEMRTPMNAVLGMTQLLMNEPLMDKQHGLVVAAHESAESLLASIDRMLDFSRMEKGDLPLKAEAFDLRALVADISAIYGAEAETKSLHWAVYLDPAIPQALYGDPVRLKQALEILLDNAVKFTSHGEIRLKIRTQVDASGADTLTFEVQDSGTGIPADKQKLVFEPFSQADNSTRRAFGGAGLGLAIVKRLVDQMGGTIRLHSGEGLGTRIELELPFDSPPDPAPERPAPIAETPPTERPSADMPPPDPGPGRARILLAEDHRVNQTILLGMLRNLDLAVVLAHDGQEAAALADQNRAQRKFPGSCRTAVRPGATPQSCPPTVKNNSRQDVKTPRRRRRWRCRPMPLFAGRSLRLCQSTFLSAKKSDRRTQLTSAANAC